ncbi:MAG: hypothetical protein ACLPYY_12535 [Acidimicrobiales bacterium]
MDVQADEAGLRPDPSATATFQRLGTGREGARAGGQQQLFADAYPTYADTDKIPAVRGGRRGADGSSRSGRLLRVAVVVVALAVLAGGAALGLVKAGVIGNGTGTGTSAAPPAHHATVTVPSTPLLTPISTGAGTASYKIDIAAYAVTVATSTGRSWVSIGIIGQHPIYAGILAPGASQKEILLGSSQIDIGAGGTKLIVTSGHRSVTLTPPSAPFSYQLMTTS